MLMGIWSRGKSGAGGRKGIESIALGIRLEGGGEKENVNDEVGGCSAVVSAELLDPDEEDD